MTPEAKSYLINRLISERIALDRLEAEEKLRDYISLLNDEGYFINFCYGEEIWSYMQIIGCLKSDKLKLTLYHESDHIINYLMKSL